MWYKIAAIGHMIKNIGRGNGDAILEIFTIFNHTQRNDADVVFFHQFLTQVTGAVR